AFDSFPGKYVEGSRKSLRYNEGTYNKRGGRTMETIRWSQLQQGDWDLIIAATDKGLCWIGSEGCGFDELEQWAEARRRGAGLVRDDRALDPYRTQLEEYFDGSRT